MELITSFQTEIQRARVSIAAALDCLGRMPDASHYAGNVNYNMAHWAIMCGMLQRIDYELHGMQNSVIRKQGAFPHEVYNDAVGRAVVHTPDDVEIARLDAQTFVTQFEEAIDNG